jgi:hypothetical protein
MDLVGYSICLRSLALRQWSFCIPGFIYYLNGAFRNLFQLTLIDLEALEGAANRFVADQMWSDTFREKDFRREIERPGRDRMTKRPG